MALPNAPEVKLAVVGVSRDCFPAELTRTRLSNLVESCKSVGVGVFPCETIIETENDTLVALEEAWEAGCNAAVIYLGNFGPEGPESIFAERFGGPVMACAASEESKSTLMGGRGDAYCGMLNASYNFALRNVPVYIPQMPVGLPDELAQKIKHFETVARIVIGVQSAKIFSFGPRPENFYACNAPIKPLYNMGVEIMENSELDLYVLYNAVDPNDPEIAPIVEDMVKELGAGNKYPDILPKLARFELALTRFCAANLGSRDYAIFANKCWPAFQEVFGFVPCYVNSRLASRGIPVACEVDIYGALSEYMCYLATGVAPTLLDINNTVPTDMLEGQDLKGATPVDLFMGFHCGNTPSCCMKSCGMNYQVIMNRLLEDPTKEPDITRGTLEGQIKPGPTTFFRVQGNADGELVSYIADGNILDIDPATFGGTGIFAVPNFARFYRHVLIAKQFPHHGAVAFETCGKALYDAAAMLGVEDINVPLPNTMLYPGENPFELA